MPAVRTTATSKATRRTSSPIGTQASSRPLRRGSSPLLPQYLLPATGEEERLRRIEEEPEREAANAHVHELQRLAVEDPNDRAKAREYMYARDDYEEEFGKYIPDATFERWERKRDQLATDVARKVAPALRCVVAINACPLREFCLARQNFEDTCGIPFKLHPRILDDLRKKVNELLVYDNLRVVTQGDPVLMERTVGRAVATFTAINPFGMQDPRRVECDAYLRERRAWFLGHARAAGTPTLGDHKFLFQLTNEHAKNPGSVDCLMTYIKYEVWREEIRRYIAKAIKRASEEGPSAEVSVQSFYNRY
ncbi:hypothetical protein B0H13DRAFT_2305808 [Mycena leptocephala]|nr:hypothetical protein B0H13DRAFT_2305808 [Mycena leptocephala]